jgi:hypothetical protein
MTSKHDNDTQTTARVQGHDASGAFARSTMAFVVDDTL